MVEAERPTKLMKWLNKLVEGGKTRAELREWLEFRAGMGEDEKIIEGNFSEWERTRLPAGYEYIKFNIPKRNGGQRSIEAPNPLLKKLQKRVLERIMEKLKVNECCVGFRKNKSIIDAAKPHTNKEVVINLDLKDFFNSTGEARVEKCFRKIGWGRGAAKILTNICCNEGHLPQGAPTSPMLSNAMNIQMDNRIERLVKKLDGDYTRYADDITVSFQQFKQKSRFALKIIPKIIKDYGYEIQKKKKIRVQRRHQRQTVVGLVVNEKVNWPRGVRHKIRAIEHQMKLGQIDKFRENRAAGYVGLKKMLENTKT